MGSNNAIDGLIACYTHIYQFNQMAPPCNLLYLRVGNIVATFYTFPLDLEHLRSEWEHCVPEKSLFTGVYFNCRAFGLDTNIKVAFFKSGKMNFMGGKTIHEVKSTFAALFPTVIVPIKRRSTNDKTASAKQYPQASPSGQDFRPREPNFDYSKVVISTADMGISKEIAENNPVCGRKRKMDEESELIGDEYEVHNTQKLRSNDDVFVKTEKITALPRSDSLASAIASIIKNVETKL